MGIVKGGLDAGKPGIVSFEKNIYKGYMTNCCFIPLPFQRQPAIWNKVKTEQGFSDLQYACVEMKDGSGNLNQFAADGIWKSQVYLPSAIW